MKLAQTPNIQVQISVTLIHNSLSPWTCPSLRKDQKTQVPRSGRIGLSVQCTATRQRDGAVKTAFEHASGLVSFQIYFIYFSDGGGINEEILVDTFISTYCFNHASIVSIIPFHLVYRISPILCRY